MNEQVGKKIGARLKDLEKNQGWLAEKVGVSINAVSKWTKTGKIASKNVAAVAEALGLTIDELLSDSDPVTSGMVPSEDSRLERLNAEEARLVALYRESNQTARDLVLAQLAIHADQNAAARGLTRIRDKP